MYVTAETEILIKTEPQCVWNSTSDPYCWTANLDEHLSLKFFNNSNRPAQGVNFHHQSKYFFV